MNKYVFNAMRNVKSIEYICESGIKQYQIEEVAILPYWIVTECAVAPFLTYALRKHDDTNTCSFVLSQEMSVTEANIDSIVENSRDMLRKMMNVAFDKHSFQFKGLMMIGRTMVIMHELSLGYIDALMSSSLSPIIFVTIGEILNDMRAGIYRIHDDVHSLFLNNLEMCVLQNENGAIYETPCTFYRCSPIYTVEHDALFHPSNQSLKCIPVENYEECMKRTSHNNVKTGLIRICVFLCKHRVDIGTVSSPDISFDGCDSVTRIDSKRNDKSHFIRNASQLVSLSYYAM